MELKHDELVKQLRDWPRVCIQYDGSIDQLHDEAADVIEKLQAQVPKWIPVTERLPCLTTPVLATDGIEVDIAWMYGVPPRWITSFTAIDEGKLTHWMPLPKTPQPLKEET